MFALTVFESRTKRSHVQIPVSEERVGRRVHRESDGRRHRYLRDQRLDRDLEPPGGQKVAGVWNATVTQTRSAASATNPSCNAAIAPGGNVRFGFQGTRTANDTNPTAFALNGTACS